MVMSAQSSTMAQDDHIPNYLIQQINTHYIFHMVVAHSYPEFGIGKDGALPWSFKRELAHFKKVTTKQWDFHYEAGEARNIVIFGRKTWDSISDAGKKSILKDRMAVIITSNPSMIDENYNDTFVNGDDLQEYKYYTSWDELPVMLMMLKASDASRHVFFAGGQSIYELALNDYPVECVHITEVYLNKKKRMGDFDVYFPKYDPHKWLITSHCHINPDAFYNLAVYECSPFINEVNIATGKTGLYRHKTYCSALFAREHKGIFDTPWVSEEKKQYLSIMRKIMNKGIDRDDRTGTGTRSLFSSYQRYDLTDRFPMITTRRQWLKGIFEELKLYLSGKTDNALLQKKDIHIWDGNTSREFLDSRGLHRYPEGDMGETYGFNFRHIGGKYENCATDYEVGSHGYDQLANVLNLLKYNPTSRRIIINLWNPATLHNAALPSCLMMYQFYVDTVNNKLNCQIYIRSSDYFLANNWNCCTGALLVHMLCALADIPYKPGTITVITGDTHIYKTHFNQVAESLEREPVPFPKLEINSEKKYETLDDIEFDDLWLIGYTPQPSITAPMAV